MVKIVGQALQAAGPALHVNAEILAGLARTKNRKIVQMKVDIMGDKEVRPAVFVVVAERSATGPSGLAAKPSRLRDIGKRAISTVTIKHNAIETSDEQVGPAVVIVVTDSHAHRPARIAHAGLVGNIGKSSIMVVVKQGAASLNAVARHVNALRVGEIN